MSSLRTSVRYSRYSRDSKDFEALVDGAVVGHAATYSDGDALATQHLAIPRFTLVQTREQALAAVIRQLQAKWFQAVFAGDEVAVLRLERREELAKAELKRLAGEPNRAA